MATRRSSSNLNAQVPASPVGPKVADLKAKFSAGSIPLDTDFAGLIDIADCGRKAIGQSPDQSDNSIGAGLQLAQDGKLSVATSADYGTQIVSGQVGVNLGNGVQFDSGKVTVKAADGSIQVDTNGISVNQGFLFPRGVIMMYNDYGSGQVPTGWLLCDGTNQTPDLRDRFVMGGATAGDTSNTTVSGATGAKAFTATSKTSNADITVSGHTLSLSEIPSHSHNITDQNGNILKKDSNTCNENGDVGIPAIFNDSSNTTSAITFQSQGGGQAHKHDISQNPHSHAMDIVVPYYVLVFIMKA